PGPGRPARPNGPQTLHRPPLNLFQSRPTPLARRLAVLIAGPAHSARPAARCVDCRTGPLRSPGGSLRDLTCASAASLRDLPVRLASGFASPSGHALACGLGSRERTAV